MDDQSRLGEAEMPIAMAWELRPTAVRRKNK
jgi:hypothetical protein